MEVIVYLEGLILFPFFNEEKNPKCPYENVQNFINFQTEGSSCISL